MENTASDGVGWNFSRTVQARITKFAKHIEDDRAHKPVGNNITSYFRSAFTNGVKCRVRQLCLPKVQCSFALCGVKGLFKFLT